MNSVGNHRVVNNLRVVNNHGVALDEDFHVHSTF